MRRNQYSVGAYIQRDHKFKTKQFEFDALTCEATSYGWWVFVLKIGDTIYFNNARYSMQTDKHQDMASNILENSDIKSHGLKQKTLFIKEGLNHLNQAIKNRVFEITKLKLAIAKPRSWKSTNAWRKLQIKSLRAEIALYYKLLPKFEEQLSLNGRLRSEFDHKIYQKQELAREKRRLKPKKAIEQPQSETVQNLGFFGRNFELIPGGL